MRRKEFTKRYYDGTEYKFIVEEFRDYKDVIDTIESREYQFDKGAINGHSPKFYGGVENWEEAKELFLYGWNKPDALKKMAATIRKIERQAERQAISFKNDIVGFAPNVAHAVIGLPHNMINSQRQPKRQKVVTINAGVEFSASVDASDVFEWGAKLAGTIMNIEKSGYRVRLNLVNQYSRLDISNRMIEVMSLTAKKENQPFDIKRLLFPLAHAAKQRMIEFEWYRKVPGGVEHAGYGMPMNKYTKSQRKLISDAICDEPNSYYIAYGDDIEKVLNLK